MKSEFKIDTLELLPEYKSQYLTAEEVLSKLIPSNNTCKNEAGNPNVTLLDLRTEHHLKDVKRPLIIKSDCLTIFCLLDDLQKDEVRKQIPKKSLVVTVTETGNRDKFALQYLSKYGYENIYGLLFGMRGWIKAGYQTEAP